MKLRADSFAARLTPAQRDELFARLAGGLGLMEAARQVSEWTSGKPPSTQAVSAWFTGARVERRYSAAREAALVAQANCPADYDEQARLALGQAKFLAMLEDLEPRDVIGFEKNALTREKLAIDKQKADTDTRVARRDLRLDRDRLIFERLRGGTSVTSLEDQIALAIDEIDRIKTGEGAP